MIDVIEEKRVKPAVAARLKEHRGIGCRSWTAIGVSLVDRIGHRYRTGGSFTNRRSPVRTGNQRDAEDENGNLCRVSRMCLPFLVMVSLPRTYQRIPVRDEGWTPDAFPAMRTSLSVSLSLANRRRPESLRQRINSDHLHVKPVWLFVERKVRRMIKPDKSFQRTGD